VAQGGEEPLHLGDQLRRRAQARPQQRGDLRESVLLGDLQGGGTVCRSQPGLRALLEQQVGDLDLVAQGPTQKAPRWRPASAARNSAAGSGAASAVGSDADAGSAGIATPRSRARARAVMPLGDARSGSAPWRSRIAASSS